MGVAFGGSGDVGVSRSRVCPHCRGRRECLTCGNGRTDAQAPEPVTVTVWQIWFRHRDAHPAEPFRQWDNLRVKIGDGTAAYAKGFDSRESAEQWIYCLNEESGDREAELQIRRVTVKAEIISDPPEAVTYAAIAAAMDARRNAKQTAQEGATDAEEEA
jgi:hypothetical protein